MNTDRLTLMIVSIAVLFAVIFGFLEIGLPIDARGVKLDEARVANLREIKYQIENYARNNNKLPGSLKEIISGTYPTIYDPETGTEYNYIYSGRANYQLCATFKTSNDPGNYNNKTVKPDYYYSEFYHGAGYNCFSFTVTLSANQFDSNPYPSQVNEYPTPIIQNNDN